MITTIWGKGPSARKLAAALGVQSNILRADVYIRYKVLTPLPYRNAIEINTADAIRLASHKYKSLIAIQCAGVQTVPVSLNFEDFRGEYTIFARKFYHTKGKDITILQYNPPGYSASSMTGAVITARQAVDNADYFTLYLQSESEYRYHVAFSKVILPTKKILAEGEVDNTLIRNHQGGKWKQVVCRETAKFSNACIKAVNALGLHFGAVDFLSVNDEPVILEVNTAPGLQIDNRLDAYANAINEYLEGI